MTSLAPCILVSNEILTVNYLGAASSNVPGFSAMLASGALLLVGAAL